MTLALPVAGCGDEEEATVPVLNETTGARQAAQGGTTSAAPGGNTAGGATVEADAQAESLSDTPFVLNVDQPIPPDFRAAYQRQALIVVEFLKEGQDPFYPQGLEVDDFVNEDLQNLQSEYPEVEYFTYDISDPGTAETSEELERGQYGTLAAQLDVGFTPFVVMLAPRGEGQYVIANLFQGYVEEGVLSQALFDLSSMAVEGNSSDTELDLDQVELTESGGGIEYFTVTNNGEQGVVLEGFTLRIIDPETGEVSEESEGVQITEGIRVRPGRTVSVGRVPDLTDADGRTVRGTFAGGEELGLEAGQQIAILDSGGAVIDTITV